MVTCVALGRARCGDLVSNSQACALCTTPVGSQKGWPWPESLGRSQNAWGWRVRRSQERLSDPRARSQHPVLLALWPASASACSSFLWDRLPGQAVGALSTALLAGGLALSSEGFYLLGMVSQINLHKHGRFL